MRVGTAPANPLRPQDGPSTKDSSRDFGEIFGDRNQRHHRMAFQLTPDRDKVMRDPALLEKD